MSLARVLMVFDVLPLISEQNLALVKIWPLNVFSQIWPSCRFFFSFSFFSFVQKQQVKANRILAQDVTIDVDIASDGWCILFVTCHYYVFFCSCLTEYVFSLRALDVIQVKFHISWQLNIMVQADSLPTWLTMSGALMHAAFWRMGTNMSVLKKKAVARPAFLEEQPDLYPAESVPVLQEYLAVCVNSFYVFTHNEPPWVAFSSITYRVTHNLGCQNAVTILSLTSCHSFAWFLSQILHLEASLSMWSLYMLKTLLFHAVVPSTHLLCQENVSEILHISKKLFGYGQNNICFFIMHIEVVINVIFRSLIVAKFPKRARGLQTGQERLQSNFIPKFLPWTKQKFLPKFFFHNEFL